MSDFVLCPECRRKLKVPQTIGGKAFRCPGCKAIISAKSIERLLEDDSEDDEEETPSPSRSVQRTPSARPAPTSSRGRPREDEPDEDIEPDEKKPIREKPARKRRPGRKKSSKGLIIGLAAGGGVLLLLVLTAGGGALWYFLRAHTIPASEWQSFSPPNSGCTVLLPGSPNSQSLNMMGIQVKNYTVERKRENAAFAMLVFDVPPFFLRPSLLDDVARSSRDERMAQMGPGSKVTSEATISLGNIPGREYQLKPPTRGTLIARIYLAKFGSSHRIYALVAGGDYIQPNKGDASRFFDSFKLDAGAAPPSFDGGAGENKGQPPPDINPPQGKMPGPKPGRRPPRGPGQPN